MILLTPDSHLSGIIFVNKMQGIGCAEWRVCGKGHVYTIVIHMIVQIHPMHRLRGLPFCFLHGTSILDKLRNDVYQPYWFLASLNNKPMMLVLSSAVPSAFGFRRIKMAVVWL